MKKPEYKLIPVSDLIPYARNSRTHSDAQVAQIASSIKEFGFINPVITDGQNGIIAGHGRVMAAQKLGIEQLPCIEASHLSEAQKRAYVIADNQLALNAGWDADLLKVEIEDLKEKNFNTDILGFDEQFMCDLFGGEQSGLEIEAPYTAKVETPIYTPSDEKPSVDQLYCDSDYRLLVEQIDESEAPDYVKEFLRLAASRHVVFNFAKIADYYAHASAPIQQLMERQALVIIDFDQAVEYGYVKLHEGIKEQYDADYPDGVTYD